MKNISILFVIIILLISCKKEEDNNKNFFTFQGVEYKTPNAYYGIESDGIELCISSFVFDFETDEYSGSGSGVDFVKIKSNESDRLPTGTFQSGLNWGDTSSNFLGIVLMDVDELFTGNYIENEIKSGTINITESQLGYKIEYDITIDNGGIIQGQYEGEVLRN